MTRVGVVGAGVMGLHHARVLLELQHSRSGLEGSTPVLLVGLADPRSDRRESGTRELGVQVFPDPYCLMGQVDAVVIASPTSCHFCHSRDFLEEGVHVLVEKPIATSLEEAIYLVALASRKGLVLQGGHVMRFYPVIELLQDWIEPGMSLVGRRMNTGRRPSDTGVSLDLLIHDLDLSHLLLGGVPEIGEVQSTRHNGLDEEVHARLIFSNGSRADLSASRSALHVERSLLLTDPGGEVLVDFSKRSSTDLHICRRRAGVWPGFRWEQKRSVWNQNPLKRQLSHFFSCIQEGMAPRFPLTMDLLSLDLALGVERLTRTVSGFPEPLGTAPESAISPASSYGL